MEKKIVGFKSIKTYPGWKETGKIIDLSRSSQKDIKENTYYIDFPEYWEPIYEKVSVDLESIYIKISTEKTERNIFDRLTLTYRETTLEIMKEACKQTLELANKEVLNTLKDTAFSEILQKRITNLITLIK